MQILGHFCLLLIIFYYLGFHKRFFGYVLGVLLMDCLSCLKLLSQNSEFGCGFWVFGCFRQFFNVLGLFLLLILGLKVLQLRYHFKGLIQFLLDFRGKSSDLGHGFCLKSCLDGKCNCRVSCGFRGKSSDLRYGFCSKSCLDGKCNTTVSPRGLLGFLKNSEPTMISQLEETREIPDGNGDVKGIFVSNEEFAEIENRNGYVKENFDSDEEFDGDAKEHELLDEDEVADVMALRKLVRKERQRASAAYLELEKERTAAATAAEEAMAMILRIQNEKSLVEMEANQYRRLAEEKQIHDQEVIQSLRWIVMKHESERRPLEDQLRFYRRKLKLYVKGDEGDESEGIDEPLSFVNSNIEDSPGDALISSLDIDMSPPWNAQVWQ